MSELRNPLFGNWSFWTLEILFFFAYSVENAEYPRRDAPAYAGEINNLIRLDLLERREGNTFVTERGWALLNYIKSAPLPPTTEELYMEWLGRQGAAKSFRDSLDWHGGDVVFSDQPPNIGEDETTAP